MARGDEHLNPGPGGKRDQYGRVIEPDTVDAAAESPQPVAPEPPQRTKGQGGTAGPLTTTDHERPGSKTWSDNR